MKRSYANRGKWFETAIENVNRSYKRKGIALISKVATPINYNTRTGRAFHEKKSTVDFIGVLDNGLFIAFDAKQVKGKNFPFKNVSKHQVEYLYNVHNLGGHGFLLIYFTDFQECYRLTIDELIEYKRTSDRKSIPYDWFEDNAQQITSQNGVAFNYLSGVY